MRYVHDRPRNPLSPEAMAALLLDALREGRRAEAALAQADDARERELAFAWLVEQRIREREAVRALDARRSAHPVGMIGQDEAASS